MNKTLCFTSFNFDYSLKACILAKTLKKNNPEWVVAAVISDSEFDPRLKLIKKYFDVVVFSHDLNIVEFEVKKKKYSIIELCTAVKGDAACYFLDSDYKNVIYLDPDIAVFNSMNLIEELLNDYSILLTPHQLEPDDKNNTQSIRDNELASLKYGIFNLGFIAFANDVNGRLCSEWWKDRLNYKCIDSPGDGYFTDQKWCNHIPIFFSGVYILRDFGCNVASWNLNKRIIKFNENGEIFVNGDLLKFYHFSKFGPLGKTMIQRYSQENFNVFELWYYYQDQLTILEKELLLILDC